MASGEKLVEDLLNQPIKYAGHIRCPMCFESSLKLSPVQSWERDKIWECEGCGFEGEEFMFVDKTPPGCLAVTMGVEVK